MTKKNKEKQVPKIVYFLIKFFQIMFYISIQIVFIPFAIIGIIIAVYKEMIRGKKLGVSLY